MLRFFLGIEVCSHGFLVYHIIWFTIDFPPYGFHLSQVTEGGLHTLQFGIPELPMFSWLNVKWCIALVSENEQVVQRCLAGDSQKMSMLEWPKIVWVKLEVRVHVVSP